MKGSEIKIGQCYLAKVSKQVVPVRVDNAAIHGGWIATNMVTGRKVRIRGPQRFRRPASEEEIQATHGK